MTSFSFQTAQDIRFGRGVANSALGEVSKMGKSVLVVTGAQADRHGELIQILTAQGCDIAFYAVPDEPDLAMIEAGVARAKEGKSDVICAIGGGAVIDAGKAIAALSGARYPAVDYFEIVGQNRPLETPPLPFVAVPTTAGTGSEVTKNAVVSIPSHRRKVSLRSPQMFARLAIVDPALCDSCPDTVVLQSGLDAVTQVIEPFLCTKANPMTDALCAGAIPMGLQALRRLVEGRGASAQDQMSYVSLGGGIALANAGLGVVHGIAGPLGGLSQAPHGAICGALLPHALAANHARVPRNNMALAEKFDTVRGWIAQAFGGAPQNAYETLAHWSAKAGLPRLTDLGVTPSDITECAPAALGSSSMRANPCPLTQEDVEAIIRTA